MSINFGVGVWPCESLSSMRDGKLVGQILYSSRSNNTYEDNNYLMPKVLSAVDDPEA